MISSFWFLSYFYSKVICVGLGRVNANVEDINPIHVSIKHVSTTCHDKCFHDDPQIIQQIGFGYNDIIHISLKYKMDPIVEQFLGYCWCIFNT